MFIKRVVLSNKNVWKCAKIREMKWNFCLVNGNFAAAIHKYVSGHEIDFFSDDSWFPLICCFSGLLKHLKIASHCYNAFMVQKKINTTRSSDHLPCLEKQHLRHRITGTDTIFVDENHCSTKRFCTNVVVHETHTCRGISGLRFCPILRTHS